MVNVPANHNSFNFLFQFLFLLTQLRPCHEKSGRVGYNQKFQPHQRSRFHQADRGGRRGHFRSHFWVSFDAVVRKKFNLMLLTRAVTEHINNLFSRCIFLPKSIEGEYIPLPGDEVSYRICAVPPKYEKHQAIHVIITNLTPHVHHKWETPISDDEAHQ